MYDLFAKLRIFIRTHLLQQDDWTQGVHNHPVIVRAHLLFPFWMTVQQQWRLLIEVSHYIYLVHWIWLSIQWEKIIVFYLFYIYHLYLTKNSPTNQFVYLANCNNTFCTQNYYAYYRHPNKEIYYSFFVILLIQYN